MQRWRGDTLCLILLGHSNSLGSGVKHRVALDVTVKTKFLPGVNFRVVGFVARHSSYGTI